MNNYQKHAMREFRAAGWTDDRGEFKDEMQEMICDHVMKLLDMFNDEGHSGSSAHYAINLFEKLAKFEPITPLTGEDSEWNEVSNGNGGIMYQNNRCSRIFKDDSGAWDIEGKVFWEWNGTKEEPYKSYYSGHGSSLPITFPYTIPDKPIYEYRYSNATPPAPPQTEDGIL